MKKLTKAQSRIIEALRKPGAYIVDPHNSAGNRTGYVTTGGLKGYVCPITLGVFNVLKSKFLIGQKQHNSYFTLIDQVTPDKE